MDILIVSQYFWPENFRITDLALELIKRKHHVTVLTGQPNYPIGKFFKGYSAFSNWVEHFNGIKILRMPIVPRGSCNNFMLILNYLSFAISGSIRAILIPKKYDAIIALNYSPITAVYPAIIYKLKKKVKLLLWVHDLWPESVRSASNIKSDLVDQLLLKIVKSVYSNSDKILISSNGFMQSIIAKGIEESKVIYMPNWAEDIFEDASTVDRNKYLATIPKGFIVMFAGNIGDAQDFDSIIKAAEITKKENEIKWVIIGDGRNIDYVKQKLIKEGLEDTIFLLGRYPLSEMPSFFIHADIMLFSLKDELIFSLTIPGKLQSYMAFGKPIAAMINGEGANIISESHSGFVCNAGDYKQLADNILTAYYMPSNELEKLGENGYKYYKMNFNKKYLIDEFENIIKSSR